MASVFSCWIRGGTLSLVLCFPALALAAYADPPERVARLSDNRGEVSYSPAGEDAWVRAARNRPLIRGDRLWTDRAARLELQVGSAAVRMWGSAGLEILDISDGIAQLRLTQGSVNISVRRLYAAQSIEVATPNLAFTMDRAGNYRIDVDQGSTTVVVWSGAGVAYGVDTEFALREGDSVRFYSADLRDHEEYGLPQVDEFDRYCLARDRYLSRSRSLAYVSDDVVGFQDLDEYGSWSADRNYGNVWYPNQVSAGWAPYRDGEWVWQEPWGWTWVDAAPWGFAPAHYGRWVNISSRWAWMPGPRNVRPVYAPALVAFTGGRGWSASISAGGRSRIGWFPLGPQELYVPSYHASRAYFNRVNNNYTPRGGTSIAQAYSSYANRDGSMAQMVYVNRGVAGAITGASGTEFGAGQSARYAAMQLQSENTASEEILRSAPIAPGNRSVWGAAPAARAQPEAATFERRVYARNAPPAEIQPFAARASELQRTPGQAVDPAAARGRRDSARVELRLIARDRPAANARERDPGDASAQSADGDTRIRPLDRSAAPDRRRESSQSGGDAATAYPSEARSRDRQPPADTGVNARAAAAQRDANLQEQQRQVDVKENARAAAAQRDANLQEQRRQADVKENARAAAAQRDANLQEQQRQVDMKENARAAAVQRDANLQEQQRQADAKESARAAAQREAEQQAQQQAELRSNQAQEAQREAELAQRAAQAQADAQPIAPPGGDQSARAQGGVQAPSEVQAPPQQVPTDPQARGAQPQDGRGKKPKDERGKESETDDQTSDDQKGDFQ